MENFNLEVTMFFGKRQRVKLVVFLYCVFLSSSTVFSQTWISHNVDKWNSYWEEHKLPRLQARVERVLAGSGSHDNQQICKRLHRIPYKSLGGGSLHAKLEGDLCRNIPIPF